LISTRMGSRGAVSQVGASAPSTSVTRVFGGHIQRRDVPVIRGNMIHLVQREGCFQRQAYYGFGIESTGSAAFLRASNTLQPIDCAREVITQTNRLVPWALGDSPLPCA
jgi:hypothetical protein